MQMDSFVGGMGGVEIKPKTTPEPAVMSTGNTAPAKEVQAVTNTVNNGSEQEKQGKQQGREKEPAESSMKDALSKLNAQIANTHCAYSYDEDTRRISIKVYDDETDELIREIPPEKSLEALKKMWEIAGIMIDEKR